MTSDFINLEQEDLKLFQKQIANEEKEEKS